MKDYTPTDSDFQRFISRVEYSSGCWIWTAGKTPKGYPLFSWGGRGGSVSGTRFAYTWYREKVPNGYDLDHFLNCSTSCVNPWHLRIATRQDNLCHANSPIGINSRKTNCPQGHPYSSFEGGKRTCKICRADQRRKRKEAMRKAAAVI